MVHAIVRRAHTPSDAWLAGDRTRRLDFDSVADRQRKNADSLPLVPRPADVLAGASKIRAMPRALRLAAQSTRRRRRTKPAGAARRYRASSRTTWRRVRPAAHINPDWRHAPERARTISTTTR